MTDCIATSLSVSVEIGPDDDPKEVRKVLDVLVDELGIEQSDVELRAPGLFACIECGAVVSTSGGAQIVDEEPVRMHYDEEEFENIKDELVVLDENCRGWGCNANAWEHLEFGVVVQQ